MILAGIWFICCPISSLERHQWTIYTPLDKVSFVNKRPLVSWYYRIPVGRNRLQYNSDRLYIRFKYTFMYDIRDIFIKIIFCNNWANPRALIGRELRSMSVETMEMTKHVTQCRLFYSQWTKNKCYCKKQIDHNFPIVYTLKDHKNDAIKCLKLCSETTRRFTWVQVLWESTHTWEKYILIYFNAIFLEWNLSYIYLRILTVTFHLVK